MKDKKTLNKLLNIFIFGTAMFPLIYGFVQAFAILVIGGDQSTLFNQVYFWVVGIVLSGICTILITIRIFLIILPKIKEANNKIPSTLSLLITLISIASLVCILITYIFEAMNLQRFDAAIGGLSLFGSSFLLFSLIFGPKLINDQKINKNKTFTTLFVGAAMFPTAAGLLQGLIEFTNPMERFKTLPSYIWIVVIVLSIIAIALAIFKIFVVTKPNIQQQKENIQFWAALLMDLLSICGACALILNGILSAIGRPLDTIAQSCICLLGTSFFIFGAIASGKLQKAEVKG